MWLFVLFLMVPLIEIALFVQIGGVIGLWPTLGIVVVTAILGTFLVRQQGSMALNKLRSSFSELDDPTEPLAHGAMILFSGALLLTPGFFTDIVGFALLVPAIRSAVFKAVKARINVAQFQMGPDPRQQNMRSSSTIDAEYEDVTPPADSPKGPSGWTKH